MLPSGDKIIAYMVHVHHSPRAPDQNTTVHPGENPHENNRVALFCARPRIRIKLGVCYGGTLHDIDLGLQLLS